MIGIGDKIRWRTVNGYATGEVVEEFRPGEAKEVRLFGIPVYLERELDVRTKKGDTPPEESDSNR